MRSNGMRTQGIDDVDPLNQEKESVGHTSPMIEDPESRGSVPLNTRVESGRIRVTQEWNVETHKPLPAPLRLDPILNRSTA